MASSGLRRRHGGRRWLNRTLHALLLRAHFGAFSGALLTFFVSFGVGDVLEFLCAARINLRGEHAVLLVNRDAYEPLKLAWKQAVPTKRNQQLATFVENL